MLKMSSTILAESVLEAERKTTHEAISVVSPGEEDEEKKDQDRVFSTEFSDSAKANCQVAIVCDGTTTSPYSAAAAEEVAGRVQSLFQEDGLLRTAEILKQRRLALLERPLKLEDGQSAMLRNMFEEIVKQKYQNSYQTTAIAVCLKRAATEPAATVCIKAVGCGDSALFIFSENGELLYNNVNLADALDRFKHSSPLTAVLPDSYDEETKNVLFDFTPYPEDVHVLLCSDGLYDGFANFKEVSEWLQEHRPELKEFGGDAKCLSDLHGRLAQTKGDDDISFIWLHPPVRAGDVPTEEPHEEESVSRADVFDCKRSFLAKLFSAIRRWFRPGRGGHSARRSSRSPKKQGLESFD